MIIIKPMLHQVLKITKFRLLLPMLFGCILFAGCASSKDYYHIPTLLSNNSFNAVVEIPAGTNKKYEYNPIQKKFIIDTENGKERIIDFLPYPGNYGFIPSTLSKTDLGGDGDALDVLILSESLYTGTVIEALPIALLKLIDDEEIDYKVIAVPVDKSKQIITARTYQDLSANYPKLIEIIAIWFLNYNKKDSSRIEGWGNEQEALNEIKKHLKTLIH